MLRHYAHFNLLYRLVQLALCARYDGHVCASAGKEARERETQALRAARDVDMLAMVQIDSGE